jgi:hypothetical protein
MVAPVRYNPRTARLLQSLGGMAASLGGFALRTITYLTEPLSNMAIIAEPARRIYIPLIIDGNPGFGEAINTMRIIQEREGGRHHHLKIKTMRSRRKEGGSESRALGARQSAMEGPSDGW